MYNQFGKEWEAELIKLPKNELIKIIRKIQTGTTDQKICTIDTEKEAQHIVEGIINDFESGVSTKSETMGLLGEYTGRIMHIFWVNAKQKIKANPKLLNE